MLKPVVLATLLGLGLMGPVVAQEAPVRDMRGFPEADGPFSAALVVVDEAGHVAFNTPSEQGLQLTDVSEVAVGQPVFVKVLFTGMALSDGFGLVTYDIRILSPDGTVYSETDHKGLTAFRGATTRPEQIFNNSATLGIRFEDKDMVGPYRIEVTVQDVNGNRHVPLVTTLRLVK
ncbi:MAG: hypothetical protein AAGC58_04975 [Asticcacaulis sp.]